MNEDMNESEEPDVITTEDLSEALDEYSRNDGDRFFLKIAGNAVWIADCLADSPERAFVKAYAGPDRLMRAVGAVNRLNDAAQALREEQGGAQAAQDEDEPSAREGVAGGCTAGHEGLHAVGPAPLAGDSAAQLDLIAESLREIPRVFAAAGVALKAATDALSAYRTARDAGSVVQSTLGDSDEAQALSGRAPRQGGRRVRITDGPLSGCEGRRLRTVSRPGGVVVHKVMLDGEDFERAFPGSHIRFIS